MCDAQSFVSAGGDLLGGWAGAIDAKAEGDWNAAQMRIASTLAAADASRAKAGIWRDFREGMGANLAAIAVSGLAGESFDAIAEGNARVRDENMESISRDVRRRRSENAARASAAKIEARSKAWASMFAGITSAADTLGDAEDRYQENHLGESRIEYGKRSLRENNATFYNLIFGD